MAMIAMVFINLIVYMNKNVLHLEGVKPELKSLRLKTFIIPAILGSQGRTDILRLGVSDLKIKEQIILWLNKISFLSVKLNCNAVKVT